VRAVVTGGAGFIGSHVADALLARGDEVTVVDNLASGRRENVPEGATFVEADIREPLDAVFADAGPDVVFHLAAYKHVDWAEVYPEEFVDNNLHGSWSLLRAAEAAGVETVVVASTDKAALAASFYGRTKRFMEQLTAYAGRRAGAQRIAVRFVNVLGSAGSASELVLRQARANVPLTVTDTGMTRYWITMAHAATLAAHGALLAGEGAALATASDPTVLTVGELAGRIWREAGRTGSPDIDLLGIRRGETLSEVLVAPGEELGDERHEGIAAIEGETSIAGAAWVAERLTANATREEARSVWLEAMRRPGMVAAPRSA
jgi:FlaA1/EpsC-like NDP-sugar epimerase